MAKRPLAAASPRPIRAFTASGHAVALAWVLCSMGALGGPASRALAQSKSDARLAKPDFSVFVARDPIVQAELKLSERQRAAVDRALEEIDALVFALRDDQSDAAARTLIQARHKCDRRLAATLSDAQFRRLQGIILRVQGYDALFEVETARRLDVTEEQQKKIRAVLKDVQREHAELKAVAQDDNDAFVAEALKRLEQDCTQRVNAVLSAEQQKQWAQLRGAPFNLDKVTPPAPRAPELAGISAWLNSSPLTLADLRGNVVVVHFWTFQDKVCAGNYPWYRDWHTAYARRKLVVIGVHTPEFPAEQDIAAVTAQVQAHDFQFPIAIDNAAATWQAWNNPTWPAIYLIDRTGGVRVWWYGALNQEKVNGAQYLQEQIERLLAE